MLNESNIDLAKHRMASALLDYTAAVNLLDNDLFKAANNRAYYTVFHAIRAVLALEGKDFKKHSAVISYFTQHYINTGEFTKKLSDIIKQADIIRKDSDYDDFFIADKAQTKSQIESAKVFYEAVESYLNSRFNLAE